VHFEIVHSTTYTYPNSVVLSPHLLRLCPRSTGEQQVLGFDLKIVPQPSGLTQILDAEGNSVVRCWWSDTALTSLAVTASSQVITTCTNPFSFLLEPWATHFPLDYPRSLIAVLFPYIHQDLDTVATQLAQEIAIEVKSNMVDFLMRLNQRINQECHYQIRETGQPWPPWMTWTKKQGSCRDLVRLFMAACRGMGLATRFVSGYEAGDPKHEQTLHAWAEVYLPGAGWRGFDPTMGVAVCDRHVALVASAWPEQTNPIEGGIQGNQGTPSIDFQVSVKTSAQPQKRAKKKDPA
jgi:transglutaminase-like putative cysteine protease